MASIYEDLINNIETLIPTMTEGGSLDGDSDGFNFDWPSEINIHDMAKVKPGPYADLFLIGETPLDEERNGHGGMIESHVDMRIELGYKYEEAPENPIRQSQIDAMKCYDDLKRLFGRNTSITANGNEGVFDAWRYSQAIMEHPSNDALIPGRIHTFWRFKIFADRRNPDLRIIA